MVQLSAGRVLRSVMREHRVEVSQVIAYIPFIRFRPYPISSMLSTGTFIMEELSSRIYYIVEPANAYYLIDLVAVVGSCPISTNLVRTILGCYRS